MRLIVWVVLVWSIEVCRGETISCGEAKEKCANRDGCSKALGAYLVECSVMQYLPPNVCPESCKQALIVLTSTEQGEQLMTCSCKDDELCNKTKMSIEVCRPHVIKAKQEVRVNCEVAKLICEADAPCRIAFAYYERYCKNMFQGKTCSFRCKNSIKILRKLKAAAKLDTCRCPSGKHLVRCHTIRKNTAQLCFGKELDFIEEDEHMIQEDIQDNKIIPREFRDGGGASSLRIAFSVLALPIFVTFLR